MPFGDKTGPRGAGPMTGRGAGFCAGYDMPGYMNPAFGRGFGGGRGWGLGRGFGRGYGMGHGRGWRHGYYATGLPGWDYGYGYPDPYFYPGGFQPASGSATTSKTLQEEELAYLKEQSQHFTAVLEDINKRVDELQKQTEKKKDKEA